ncbi:hypothetical protein FZEAL_6985 [Fusarium zealandicum]|uniref:Uncharacterized protein n=1 Tax=Fusarium zealandicum TaxID=1053134 RepID=A0A8H4XJ31_9HYPO|nr:hypothetical protein FZEAL_6985 [Fusarium zealandicum]
MKRSLEDWVQGYIDKVHNQKTSPDECQVPQSTTGDGQRRAQEEVGSLRKELAGFQEQVWSLTQTHRAVEARDQELELSRERRQALVFSSRKGVGFALPVETVVDILRQLHGATDIMKDQLLPSFNMIN